jgi:hypothetical protein
VLSEKDKRLVAAAVAHIAQDPGVVRQNTQLARYAGAAPSEIIESMWVAVARKASGFVANSDTALTAIDRGPHRR